jgi:hypothetical protein
MARYEAYGSASGDKPGAPLPLIFAVLFAAHLRCNADPKQSVEGRTHNLSEGSIPEGRLREDGANDPLC